MRSSPACAIRVADAFAKRHASEARIEMRPRPACARIGGSARSAARRRPRAWRARRPRANADRCRGERQGRRAGTRPASHANPRAPAMLRVRAETSASASVARRLRRVNPERSRRGTPLETGAERTTRARGRAPPSGHRVRPAHLRLGANSSCDPSAGSSSNRPRDPSVASNPLAASAKARPPLDPRPIRPSVAANDNAVRATAADAAAAGDGARAASVDPIRAGSSYSLSCSAR